MTKSLITTIAKGMLIGTALFFLPPFLLLLFIPLMLFHIFMFRKMKGGNYHNYKLAFADKVRSMSDEDYEQFKSQGPEHCCGKNRKHNKQDTINI
jgi:hypothetical protein